MNLAGGECVASRVNLADLLVRRVSLNPREAATLTLAVAREWDRQRTLHGPIALPEIAGIELTDSGTVVFLVVPPINSADDARALAELLGRLLGLDEERPRRAIPGGLLITMTGRLGHLELPSATLSGFQAALGRFADEDPDALRALYWRAASRRRIPRSVATPATRQRRRERRRVNAQVSELRRSLRALGQRAFEADPRPQTPRLLRKGSRYVGGAIAAVMLAVLTTGGLILTQSAPSAPVSAQTRQAPLQRALATDAQRPVASAPLAPIPHAPRRISAAAANDTRSRQAVARRARNAPVRDSSFSRSSAGGTRGIAWLIR